MRMRRESQLSYEVHQETEKVLQFDFLVQLQLNSQAGCCIERERERGDREREREIHRQAAVSNHGF